MANFNNLEIVASYKIISVMGYEITDGISGGDAMRARWNDGDEAWPAMEEEFSGDPIEVAE